MQQKRKKDMNEIIFIITREDIYKRIFASSAYTSRAREAMGVPQSIVERMLLTPDDKEIIVPMIENSVNEIFTDISRYHQESSVTFTNAEDTERYLFNITTPENYPSENGEKLRQSVESYIANRTLQNWYTDIKPDEAAIIAAKTQNDAANIRMLLIQRRKPSKQ